jgi:kynurenine formamidase
MERSRRYPLADSPGLSLEAAKWLVETQQAMVADNFGVELSIQGPSEVSVHSYLLAKRGVSMIEALWLQDLAKDEVYGFLFIASPLKVRGGTGSPLHPLAISVQQR